MEDINFSMKELHSSQREVSIIFYMQKIFPGYYFSECFSYIVVYLFGLSRSNWFSYFLDEWKNFLERMGCENLDGLKDKSKEEDLRNWASYRGQTLGRTGAS